MKKPVFNYIITIHNKEDLLQKVLTGVVKCCGPNSVVYPVLDGCTDASEAITDEIIRDNPNVPIHKLYENNVHEILSINAALKVADQSKPGYNIILQDDVILADETLEEQVQKLYGATNGSLGYVSFRMGADLAADRLTRGNTFAFDNYVENAYGPGLIKNDPLLPGQFAFRQIAIKSPVCIPTAVINRFGLLDEKLVPCCHDDVEYCLRMLGHGYQNGVYGLKLFSDVDWGTTRRKPDPKFREIIYRNTNYVADKYRHQIPQLRNTRASPERLTIGNVIGKERLNEALGQHRINRKKMEHYQLSQSNFFQKFKLYLHKLWPFKTQ